MSRGVNKVILIGNLGSDPEVRYMPSGSAIANLSVATNESWKDKQTGELQERTEWHKVSLFDKLAQIAAEYLKKGAKVYIEGSLRTRKWQDQSGNDRYITEIIGNSMQMLDSRLDNNRVNKGSSAEQHNFDLSGEFKTVEPSIGSTTDPSMATLEHDDIPF